MTLRERAIALFSKGIDKLQETFPVNRVVVLLTPIAFVPAAGWVTAYAAQNLPGLPAFSTGAVTGFFVAGAIAALTAAYKWIDGWQKYQDHVNRFVERERFE